LNVAHLGLGDKSKIDLPPSSIELALIKIIYESEGFAHFRQKFSKISEAKVKGGIFFCPQITQLFEDRDFSKKLNSKERRAWKASENVCSNFTGIEKEENYNEILRQLILSYSALGCSMSLILHCPHSYSDFFMKSGSRL
jgi:hypothetical protein